MKEKAGADERGRSGGGAARFKARAPEKRLEPGERSHQINLFQHAQRRDPRRQPRPTLLQQPLSFRSPRQDG